MILGRQKQKINLIYLWLVSISYSKTFHKVFVSPVTAAYCFFVFSFSEQVVQKMDGGLYKEALYM